MTEIIVKYLTNIRHFCRPETGHIKVRDKDGDTNSKTDTIRNITSDTGTASEMTVDCDGHVVQGHGH